jgi:hypothetical protein
MNGPETRWPRRRYKARCFGLNWGNPKLTSSSEQLEARLGGLGARLPYGPDDTLNL